MISINNYLMFKGNCREAIHFYKDALGGTMIEMQTFGEGPMDTPSEMAEMIMHATMDVAGNHVMFADGMEEDKLIGDNIQLSINCESVEEQTDIWNKLTIGGQITMPLDDTFWGARFGMLKDIFGINWMLNYDYPDKKK